jgi:hypothetical protein
MRHLRVSAPVAVAAVLLAACGESGPPVPVPTSLSLSSTAITITALGGVQQLTASVQDQNGQTMTGQTIVWDAANTGVATVSATGVVMAVANGQTQVTATSGTLSGNATVTVAQAVAQLAKTAGDAQTGTVGTQLAAALEVEAQDSRGNVVPSSVAGATVAFAVTQGNGSVTQTSVATDANGRASTQFTLGTAAGTGHQVTATVSGGAGSTQFSATALAGTADSLALLSGDNQVGTSGQALPDSIAVSVMDAYGNRFPGGRQVTFAAANGGSVSPATVTTDSAGRAAAAWTLGAGTGTQGLSATASGLNGSPVAFTATASSQVPTALVKVAGDGFTGLVGKPANEPPTVRVADQIGAGIAGVTVNFAVMSGGGSIGAASAVTDTNGLAWVDWTIGSSAGSNSVQASSGALTAVTFTATGQTAGFNIVVRYFGTQQPTANQQAAFAAAQAKWETLIFGDLEDWQVNLSAAWCGSNFPDLPAVNEVVDDILIYAKVDSIDGAGGVLGSAGPCYARGAGVNTGSPFIGVMRFDKADLQSLEASGQLNLVILHEMGHVLGYGVLWNQVGFSLLANACPSATGCTTDPHFTGAHALAAFDRVGGSSYVLGAKVPAEDCVSTPGSCGSGTVNVHWREAVLDRELMTGYLNSGTNPLSIVTLGSFWDLNYLVNYADADPYAWPTPPALRALTAGPVIRLTDDILQAPIKVVDRGGRVIRVIQPPGAQP